LSQARLTLPALAWRRLTHQRAVSAGLAQGLVTAVALTASVQLVEALATEAGLRSTLNGLGDHGVVTVEQFNTRDANAFESFQQDAGRRVQAAVGSHVHPGAEFPTVGPYFPAFLNGQTINYDAVDPQPTLAYYRDLTRHVRVVAGQMPADVPSKAAELLASLSQAAMEIFKLKLGDRYCVSFARNTGAPQSNVALTPRILGEPEAAAMGHGSAGLERDGPHRARGTPGDGALRWRAAARGAGPGACQGSRPAGG